MSKLFSTEGIIFRTIKYAETSIIADIYTREKGLKSFIISGVRTPKAGAKAAILRTCNYVQLIAYESEGEKLSRIKEINLLTHFMHINLHVLISSVAMFMLETCRNAIKEREPNAELYDFLKDWFHHLDTKINYTNISHIKFLLDLSYYLGFGPLQNYSSDLCYFDMLEGSFCGHYDVSSIHLIDENLSKSVAFLLEADRDELQNSLWSKDDRNKITDHLLQYYKLHISGFKDINSLDILRNVLQ